MKKIEFSKHALLRMEVRGATKEEGELAIRMGEIVSVKQNQIGFRKKLWFPQLLERKIYKIKQVIPIVAEEIDKSIVVTVYTFYF